MNADERGASPVALVTCANHGIGFKVCRQLAREYEGGPRRAIPRRPSWPRRSFSGEGFVLYHAVGVSEDEKRRCKVRRESPAPKNLRLEPL